MDERLEAVSEKIRMGIPVSMMEAIDYQQKLKADRDAARAKIWALEGYVLREKLAANVELTGAAPKEQQPKTKEIEK